MSKAVSAKPSSAEICKENGWWAGTVLEGDEGWGMEQIVITAVGEHKVLARRVNHVSWAESLWDLHHREWRKVVTTEVDKLQKQLESDLAGANEGRYATLLEDDRTEGYILGLERALDLIAAAKTGNMSEETK